MEHFSFSLRKKNRLLSLFTVTGESLPTGFYTPLSPQVGHCHFSEHLEETGGKGKKGETRPAAIAQLSSANKKEQTIPILATADETIHFSADFKSGGAIERGKKMAGFQNNGSSSILFEN
ncbi:hypothetical protein CDAR_245361 [Caerostris darwini]|uniref:Uncharacterized protein n=1 Tax=Caerostris darwini TaxID=1538125 RepID=A0AAV4NY13_9ARAC|nr:hypothetical protein CDAR_245361 [Caerostris darwini]